MTWPREPDAFGPDPAVVYGEYERLKELAKTDPEKAWRRLLEITRETDDDSLYWVADIAEDLVIVDAEAFVPRFEGEAGQNPRFRQALIDLTPTAPTEALNDRLLVLRLAAENEFGVPNDGDAHVTSTDAD